MPIFLGCMDGGPPFIPGHVSVSAKLDEANRAGAVDGLRAGDRTGREAVKSEAASTVAAAFVNASNFDPRSDRFHPADFAIKVGIPRGSRSTPIATPHRSRKVSQVQTLDRSSGWGHGSARFRTRAVIAQSTLRAAIDGID
jgi:hypothetical protein